MNLDGFERSGTRRFRCSVNQAAKSRRFYRLNPAKVRGWVNRYQAADVPRLQAQRKASDAKRSPRVRA
jgi:hypothetical protein